MEIRTVKENDLYNLLELYTQLHGNLIPKETKHLLELWEGIIDDPNHHIIVAAEGERILSTCVVVIIPNLTHGQRPYALIENVVTHQSHRRKGLAAACIKRARRLATERGCYKIMLMTGAKDEGTLTFYEKCGFNRQDKTAFIQWPDKV